MHAEPIYHSWQAMKGRCLDKKDAFYADYGGNGITIHPPWIDSFEAFYRDLGNRPVGTTLDRYPNQNGNYVPGNVRWATHKEQQRNRSSNRLLTYNGETMTLVEWSERLGINRRTLCTRLNKLRWSVERALSEKIR